MSRYGRLTADVVSLASSPWTAPVSSKPDRNWLDTSAASPMPAARMGPVSRSGSRPGSPSSSTVTPMARKASIWSSIGRSRIWGSASTTTGAAPRATAGVRKRAVVPDWRTSIDVSMPGSSPPQPSTVTVSATRSISREMPSSARAANIASVSSAKSTPRSVVSPSASAAATSARFVMLFEPGRVIVVSGGAVSGVIS